MASRHFQELLKKMDAVHIAKNHDYTMDGDPFSNFRRAAELVSWFKNDQDKVFACMVGIKLARLAELLGGKEPKNESLDDSFLDGTNYMGLWAAYHLSERDNKLPQSEMHSTLIEKELVMSEILNRSHELNPSHMRELADYLNRYARDKEYDLSSKVDSRPDNPELLKKP